MVENFQCGNSQAFIDGFINPMIKMHEWGLEACHLELKTIVLVCRHCRRGNHGAEARRRGMGRRALALSSSSALALRVFREAGTGIFGSSVWRATSQLGFPLFLNLKEGREEAHFRLARLQSTPATTRNTCYTPSQGLKHYPLHHLAKITQPHC